MYRSGAAPQKLGIKLAAGGGTEVVGLTKFPIDTSEYVSTYHHLFAFVSCLPFPFSSFLFFVSFFQLTCVCRAYA